MWAVPLPPGVNPIAAKYISYHNWNIFLANFERRAKIHIKLNIHLYLHAERHVTLATCWSEGTRTEFSLKMQAILSSETSQYNYYPTGRSDKADCPLHKTHREYLKTCTGCFRRNRSYFGGGDIPYVHLHRYNQTYLYEMLKCDRDDDVGKSGILC